MLREMIADLVPAPAEGITAVAILIVVAVVGFFAAFALIWCLVVILISWIGDWHRLATVYAGGDRVVAGQRHAGVVGWVGISRYKGVLILTIASDGFFLEVATVFRFGHPRLFIPWSALGERQTKHGGGGFWSTFVMGRELLVCEVGRPRPGVVALPAELFKPPV